MLEVREGTVFASDYRIVRRLAEGGMGAVYVADQLSTGRRRALKVMLPRLLEDDTSRARFAQEARVGALVDSDHVVEVIAAGIEDGAPWMAMELLAGETLRERVERRGPLSIDEVREVFSQLGHALSRAHAAGLVHRDLKPENVFLAEPRRTGVPFTVKILDFGIAKLVLEAQGRSTSGTQAIGSPLWMAPEQANAHAVSAATDVWALGLVAFYTLTARSYWKSAAREEVNLTSLLVEMLIDPIDPPSARAASLGARLPCGAAFDAWFGRCVAREPSARFPDAGAATDALLRALDPASDVALAPTRPAADIAVSMPRVEVQPRRRSPVLLAIAGGLALAGIAALGVAVVVVVGDPEPAASVEPPPVSSARSANEEPGMEALTPRSRIAPTPATVAIDAGRPAIAPEPIAPVSRPRPSRSPSARALESIVRPCWQDVAPQEATRMRIELVSGAPGRIDNVRLPVRWQGTPFARCVVSRLPVSSGDASPVPASVVLALPAT